MRTGLFVALRLAGRAAPAVVVDGVAVVVNGDIVTLGELEEAAGPSLPPAGSTGDAARRRDTLLRRSADDAVARKLLEKEARAQGLEPTAAEVDNAIEDVQRTNNIDRPTLERALSQQGLTLASYRALLEAQLTRMKVVEAKVKPRVSVSEDDVKARYARMTEGIVVKREVRLRDLFLPVDHDRAEVRARLDAARRQIEGGRPFAEVSRAVGGPLADSGGDLGWVSEGTMLPELEKVAFALGKGELSPVFEAGGGVHLVLVEDMRQTGGARSLAEAREEIRQQLLAERLEKATDDYLASLRKDADVEVRLP
jgi:peptidyl-prolyl cis-trans isomerase SurA